MAKDPFRPADRLTFCRQCGKPHEWNVEDRLYNQECSACSYSFGTRSRRPLNAWADNGVQFPRLLAELRACGLTSKQYKLLQDSMDLDAEGVDEILERAEAAWNHIKRKED